MEFFSLSSVGSLKAFSVELQSTQDLLRIFFTSYRREADERLTLASANILRVFSAARLGHVSLHDMVRLVEA